MANGLEMTPEELAKHLEEVRRHGARGRPLPPPPPGWTLAAWLRFLGAAGLLIFAGWFLVKRSRQAYHYRVDVAPLPAGGPPLRFGLTGCAEAGAGDLACLWVELLRRHSGVRGQNVEYTSWTQLWLATRCNLTFTVHCECV